MLRPMDAQPTQISLTKSEARAGRGMVATKDALATQAGLEILEAGGNAVDAAVAACLAAGVVEPMSSGIGGGGYLVYQMEEKGGVIGFPMRGPLAAKPDMYELTGEPSVGNFAWAGVADNENLEGVPLDRNAGRRCRAVRSPQAIGESAPERCGAPRDAAGEGRVCPRLVHTLRARPVGGKATPER